MQKVVVTGAAGFIGSHVADEFDRRGYAVVRSDIRRLASPNDGWRLADLTHLDELVEVTPDNFDSVLESMKPHLSFAVENKLSEDSNAGQIRVDLKFKSLEDFEPEQVARQVKPLKELLDLRTRLNDLKGTLQTNDKLDEALLDAVSKTDKLDKLKAEVGQKGEPNA